MIGISENAVLASCAALRTDIVALSRVTILLVILGK